MADKSTAVKKENETKQPVNSLVVNVRSLADLFLSEIKDMYWSENHLVTVALPKMIEAAAAPELKKAFQGHLEVTKTHVQRLEDIFEKMGEDILAKKCPAMEGLCLGGEQMIESTEAGTATRDKALIMSALKVENFESTVYAGLAQTATSLGNTEVADILNLILEDEEEAFEQLQELAEPDDK